MQEDNPWSILGQSWQHIELPGYRDFVETYGSFSSTSLPPISIPLDDECQWLMKHGTEHQEGLDKYHRVTGPDWPEHEPGEALRFAEAAGIDLPGSFRRFMSSPELQSRVRSCTDCYLDPGDRAVKTVGALPGHLMHFLSDSQACVLWYLHVLPDGRAAVLTSENLYCHNVTDPSWESYPTCSLDEIDLAKQEFSCCALSFSEFLYHFWIENEIWFALRQNGAAALKPLERAYLEHYKTKA